MSNWQTLKLDDWVTARDVELGRGNIISQDDINNFPGSYPIYSSSAHKNGKFGEYAKYMFEEELITWSVDGGGYFFYRPRHRFSVTNVCGYMRVKTENLYTPFVYYYLSEQHKKLTFDYTTKAHPSVIRNLYWLPRLKVDTQRKIATILQTIDRAIAHTEALIEKYQQIKAGLMHDLFTRGIGADGKLRPSRDEAPELYQESAIGWISREWTLESLEKLSCQVVDGTHFTPTYVEYGVPFLRVTDIQLDEVSLDKVKFISNNEHNILAQRCEPRRGDVLLSKNGTVGIAKVVDWDWKFSIFVSLCLIRPNEQLVAEYLASLFSNDLIWSQIRRRSKQGTVTNLHLEEIREILIPLPKIDEQFRITKSIDSATQKVINEQSALKHLRMLKSGLMQDLLTGKVPVKVNPDEVSHV